MLNISKIWEENADFVFKVCMRCVKKKSVAEDIRQEVFLKVIRYIDTFKYNSSIKTWLYKISLHCCVNYFRIKKKQNSLKENLAKNSCLYETNSIKQDKYDFYKIECPFAQLFTELYYEEGWSKNDISKVFGFNKSQVYRKIKKGVQELKRTCT